MRSILLCLMGLVILGPAEVYSTDISDTTKVLEMIEEARGLYKEGKLNLTISRANETLRLSNEVNFLKGKAYSNFLLGLCFNDKSDLQKAIIYFDNALLSKIQLGDKIGIAELYTKRGVAYKNLGKFLIAEDNYKQAKYIFDEIENQNKGNSYYLKRKANLLSDFGVLNKLMGRFEVAIDYYLESIIIRKEIDDIYGVGSCYANISNVYREIKQYNLMTANLLAAKENFQIINSPYALEKIYTLLGDAFVYLDKLDSADYYLKLSLDLNSVTNSTRNLVISYSSVGDILFLKGDYYQALKIFKEAYDISIEKNFTTFIPSICYSIAKVNIEQGEFVESHKWIIEGYDSSIEMGDQSLKLDGLFLFSEHYKNINNYDSAYSFLKSYYELSNITNGVNVLHNIIEKENNYSNHQLISKLESTQEELLVLNNKQKNSKKINRLLIVICISLIFAFFYLRKKTSKMSLKINDLENTNDILKRSRPYVKDGKLAVKIV